jgi:aspartyl-tRNA(Asn)/glutamyl-tRNA(Gln) amidotransferase subunit A
MSFDILNSNIPTINSAVRDKKISYKELVDFYINRAKKHSNLNSYISIMEKEAIERTRTIDAGLFSDEMIKGIPVSLKDIFVMKGHRTTCASKILSDHVGAYDSTVASRLQNKGAVIIGKNNMDEFAMGSSNEHSFYGPVLNPWDESRVPGGSSGGSAVSVSAGLCQISYGTDTGGSVRLPASYTGICSLKPTYGRVSRYGVIAFASSLDQPGPMARNIEDLAIAFDAVSGHDTNDSNTSSLPPSDIYKGLNKKIKPCTLGVPYELLSDGIDKDVIKCFESSLDVFKKAGYDIKDVKLPHAKHSLDAYYIISTGEASSNLSRYDGIRYGYRTPNVSGLKDLYENSRSEGFGAEVKRRIALGTFVLSAGYYDAYFIKAAKVRRLIKQDFENAFNSCSAILLPTAPTTAFKIGEKLDDPMTMYLSDVLTVPVNLAAIPALSIPCGFDSKGLPIGLQIIGKHFDEMTLFNLAYFMQGQRPELFNRVSVK